MKLTGGEIVAKALTDYGIEYVAGIPGHGNWSLTDAFLQDHCKLPFIQVMHEQSAIHIADGYWRASGKPMAATTSVGPGATNTVIGLATCFADSTAVFYVNGSPATHMKGHGVMQELERGDSGLRSFASVNVPAGADPTALAPLEVRDLPGGRYAIAIHKGPYADLHLTWDRLFSAWLPQSGEEAEDRPAVEEYLNNPRDTPPADLMTAVCLALKG